MTEPTWRDRERAHRAAFKEWSRGTPLAQHNGLTRHKRLAAETKQRHLDDAVARVVAIARIEPIAAEKVRDTWDRVREAARQAFRDGHITERQHRIVVRHFTIKITQHEANEHAIRTQAATAPTPAINAPTSAIDLDEVFGRATDQE